MQSDKLSGLLIDRLRDSGLDEHIVSEFVGVVPSTVVTWLVHKRLSGGETLNRLWHLLAFTGEPSPELDRVWPYGRYLGELMAFGVITKQEASEACGNVNDQAIFRVIRGTQQRLMRPQYSYEELKELYDGSLQKVKAEWRGRLNGSATSKGVGPGTKAVPSAPSATPAPRAAMVGTVSQDHLVRIAHDLVEAAVGARFLVSEASTPEARDFVRQLLGENGMFELSNLLAKLCSERALKQ